MATSGSVPCPRLGITPDAPTLKAALGKRKKVEKVFVGPKRLRRCTGKLNATGSDDVDLVALGSPNLSIPDGTGAAARRKTGEGRQTALDRARGQMLGMASRMGLVEPIEKSGATLLTGICNGPLTPSDKLEDKPKVVATNSVKDAHYINAG